VVVANVEDEAVGGLDESLAVAIGGSGGVDGSQFVVDAK
jgi:hypothetical protein